MQNSDYEKEVAGRLIEQLKAGVAPWQKPWKGGELASILPVNAVTGVRYSGGNVIQLMSQGRTNPQWATFNQIKAAGWHVRKGERATPIQFWKSTERETTNDAGEKELRKSWTARIFYVFNGEQIDGIPPMEAARTAPVWVASSRLQALVADCGATVHHGGRNAYYRPSADTIHMPAQSAFPSLEKYSETLLHELGHWTGHPDRLKRDMSGSFGSVEYAREELVAEIASLMTGAELGVGHDGSAHAAYVGHWIELLQNDPREIFRAASAASKARAFVMERERTWFRDNTMLAADVERLANNIHWSIAEDEGIARDLLLSSADLLEAGDWQAAKDLMTRAAGFEALQKDPGHQISHLLAAVEEAHARRMGTPSPTADMETPPPPARPQTQSRTLKQEQGRARA
ncbi:DUF1738 domain-containing protein [Bacillus sp. NP157]|nr:DUF1738 domain-containing protein [Bacillus sp. NP157]